MPERSIVIIGLPASGKTTFLAALWHLITSRDIESVLRFKNLLAGETSHLNTIAKRWRDANIQDRTAVTGTRLVSMNLLDAAGLSVRVTFPDVPGETYKRMWEDRDCEPEIIEILKNGDVLLFVHADTIHSPQWVVEEVALSKAIGLEIPEQQAISWHPRLAPTQVQLVDLLQLLHQKPINAGSRRLAIMLSAWDKARGEGLTPSAYLEGKLPLLAQYLRNNTGKWTTRIYGVSAQGGEYDPIGGVKEKQREAENLRNLDRASTRIQLVGPTAETHDLTEPLAWLMS